MTDTHRYHAAKTDVEVNAEPIGFRDCIHVDYENVLGLKSSELIREAYKKFGFLTVQMPTSFEVLVNDLHQVSRDFFALDQEQKNLVAAKAFEQSPYSNIGYFPMGTEKAQSAQVPDIKEFIHIGRSPKSSLEANQLYVDIPWNENIADIGAKFRHCYDQMAEFSESIFLAIASAFEVDAEYASDLVSDGNSILRSIYYPPVDGKVDGVRAAAHYGMNLIGVQVKSTDHGLQFCTPQDRWIYLKDWPATLVTVNVGRMFAYILNGRVRPTLHRVANDILGSSNASRYTSVMFFHGNPEKDLIPMQGKEALEPVKIGDWTSKRLKEIKIK
jgi:isopenicillin N synthase-like dioxygenase